ncbi:MAG: hypothetical protein N2V78_06745 [Methanophagales archaeon]|nr:hypothetical protein [Methanophagales archaeon]
MKNRMRSIRVLDRHPSFFKSKSQSQSKVLNTCLQFSFLVCVLQTQKKSRGERGGGKMGEKGIKKPFFKKESFNKEKSLCRDKGEGDIEGIELFGCDCDFNEHFFSCSIPLPTRTY